MAIVHPLEFARKAGMLPERWNYLTGRVVQHVKYGPGKVILATVENGTIRIEIDFWEKGTGLVRRSFGADVMAQLNPLEFKLVAVSTRPVTPIIETPAVSLQSEPIIEDPIQNRVNTPEYPQAKYTVHAAVRMCQNHKISGRVIKPVVFNGDWYYEVFFSAENSQIVRESDLEPNLPKMVWGNREDLLRDLAMIKLRKPLSDALYALYSSRTQFAVYQFKPAIKFLRNPDQRMLIADEVGLGKTIEAGIIYLELQARIGLERVLIVCPSSLRQKWQDEMKMRFDEDFAILDSGGLSNFLHQYQLLGENAHLRGIVSLELVRNRKYAEAFGDIRLDLVIIDEAHHCRNTTTLANAVASTLTENSDSALLLTATPLQTGREDLFNLLNILSPGEFDNYLAFVDRLEPNRFINRAAQMLASDSKRNQDALVELRHVESTSQAKYFQSNPYFQEVKRILSEKEPSNQALVTAQRRLLELNTLASIFTRTRKREVIEQAPQREAVTITVEFTQQERNFYDAIVDEVRWDFYQSHLSGQGSAWITIMKERQVASCISAMQRSRSEKRIEISPETEMFEESFKETYRSEDHDEETNDWNRNLFDVRPRRPAGNLPKVTGDSKFDIFYKTLQAVLKATPQTKILVFSFFKGTIDYLYDELRKRNISVCAIHGGYKVLDRYKIIEQFRDDPSIRILISSDVGSEGLDFQFCDTLFNYDLPWNPMKVEQRIGRIDRFGQVSPKVHIFNMVIKNTIEDRILSRLYDRIRIFEESVGDIEEILGNQIRELTTIIFSKRLTPKQEEQEAERIGAIIERTQQELEEFESKRGEFLGQDAIFSALVSQTKDSGRYVSDAEVEALVKIYLKENFPLTTLLPDPEEASFCLSVNSDFFEEIRVFLSRRKNDQTTQQFLRRLRVGHELPITFSNELAYQRKLLEFVTPRHPLALAALDYWSKKSKGITRNTRIQVSANHVPAGLYYFYLFSVNMEGVEQETRLLPVVVSAETKKVERSLSDQFLRFVQTSGQTGSPITSPITSEDLASAEGAALFYMSGQQKILEEDLNKSNEALLNARKTAVEQSYQAKKRQVESALRKVSDQSIQRMRKSQLNNMKIRFKGKIKEIEAGNKTSVTFSLDLRGLVEVVRQD